MPVESSRRLFGNNRLICAQFTSRNRPEPCSVKDLPFLGSPDVSKEKPLALGERTKGNWSIKRQT